MRKVAFVFFTLISAFSPAAATPCMASARISKRVAKPSRNRPSKNGKVRSRLEGLVAPLDRNNVDTDAIIPKQFLKSIKRSGFGPNAFDEWRYMDVGQPGQDAPAVRKIRISCSISRAIQGAQVC
jgi:hypothetical protein